MTEGIAQAKDSERTKKNIEGKSGYSVHYEKTAMESLRSGD
jgi:hypothetical protein